MIPELWRRLAYYLRRHRFEEELDEEIRHHLAMSGRWRFGNVTRWKEQSRAVWNWTLLEQLAQDLRHALRAIIHNRIFTALAVLSLALGIGANTAIFSFMDAILLRSLPVNDPASLVVLNWRSKAFGRMPGAGERSSVAGDVELALKGILRGHLPPERRRLFRSATGYGTHR